MSNTDKHTVGHKTHQKRLTILITNIELAGRRKMSP